MIEKQYGSGIVYGVEKRLVGIDDDGIVYPDPTLIGSRNHRQQASDGPSELFVPLFDNSPQVVLWTSDPNICDRYNVWSRTVRGLVIFVGSGCTFLEVGVFAVWGLSSVCWTL